MDQNVRWSLELEKLSIERLSLAPSANSGPSAQRLNNFYAEAATIHRGPQRKTNQICDFLAELRRHLASEAFCRASVSSCATRPPNKTLPNVRYVFAFCMPVNSLPIDTIGAGT